MSTLSDLDAAIQELATTGVASVTVDGMSVANKSLDELIRWRKELQASQSATRVGFGLRFQKIRPTYE